VPPPPAPPDLASFCEEQFPRLVRMLDLLAGDVFVAEELAQEALVRASSRWSTVRELDAPAAWLRVVARNLAASRWRRLQAERRAATRHGAIADRTEPVDVATQQHVRGALLELKPADREVLVLRHHLGLTVEETAAELRLTPSAVKSRTARAVARLRVLLDDPKETADA
jgi:RNA polymerase sigma factor (sigma-70 family)